MLNNFFTENNFWSILILIILVIFSLLIGEFTNKKKKGSHEEVIRKIPHMLVGVIFSISPIFMTSNEIIISAIVLFFGIWIGKYSPLFKTIFSIKRITVGMWMTPLSLGIMSWIWLPEHIVPFMVGMFVLTFSDALAAIFGRIYGEIQIPWTQKTVLGSSTFFLSSFIILWIFSKEFSFFKLFSISLFLTFTELILIFGLDNLFIPILTSYLFYWFLF